MPTLERREHATSKAAEAMQSPREGVFGAMNQFAHAILKRLHPVTKTSGTYRRHAFYESASYLSLQLVARIQRSGVRTRTNRP